MEDNVRHNALVSLALVVITSVFAVHACAEGCARKPENAVGWEPPSEGIVTNARDAVKIASIAWSSVNPRAKNLPEADWQQSMQAVLTDHIWKVSRKKPTDTIGGDLVISISQCDGRVLDVLLTQ
jgi:hypothetical protein